MRRVIVDYDGEPEDGIQNLRDPDSGQYIELDAIVGHTIVGIRRGEDDQLIFEFDGEWDDNGQADSEAGDDDPEPLDFSD